MARIRTIREIIELLRAEDPDTAITEKILRRAILNNIIPYRRIGKKYFVDYDEVCAYFGRKEERNYEKNRNP